MRTGGAPLATFVLIHGAAGSAWDWHLLVPELQQRGHDVVAVDLPCENDSAGLPEYAETVVDAIGERQDLVVVAHSFAGFTAPLVCERVPVRLLVLLNAMVPAVGESPGEWWEITNHAEAQRRAAEAEGVSPETADDLLYLFFEDVPPDLTAEAMRRERRQSGTPLEKPWPLERWPDVPTRVLLSRHDHFFPRDFMRRLAQERLGSTADEIDGGHVVALSRPRELAERLEGYAREAGIL